MGAMKSQGMIWRRKRLLWRQERLWGDAVVPAARGRGDGACGWSGSVMAKSSQRTGGREPGPAASRRGCELCGWAACASTGGPRPGERGPPFFMTRGGGCAV